MKACRRHTGERLGLLAALSCAWALAPVSALAQERTAEIALTWSGRADLDLVVVDPDGHPVASGVERLPGNERLVIPADRAFGRWLVCVSSRRGAAEFELAVRVGDRTGTTSGSRERAARAGDTCTPESESFVSEIALGTQPASPPPSPVASAGERSAAGSRDSTPAPGRLVQFHIEHNEHGNVPVSWSGTGGQSACATPCDVQVESGTYEVRSGRAHRQLALPPGSYDLEVDQGLNDASYTSYIMSSILGPVGLLTATLLMITAGGNFSELNARLPWIGIAGGFGLVESVMALVYVFDVPDGGIKYRIRGTSDWQSSVTIAPTRDGVSAAAVVRF